MTTLETCVHMNIALRERELGRDAKASKTAGTSTTAPTTSAHLICTILPVSTVPEPAAKPCRLPRRLVVAPRDFKIHISPHARTRIPAVHMKLSGMQNSFRRALLSGWAPHIPMCPVRSSCLSCASQIPPGQLFFQSCSSHHRSADL